MIRPFTAVCMLAAGASGLFLYQTKHRAVMLDRQIMSVLKQTDATRERIGVMRAEWALLNEPDRLAELSGKHLGLRTLAPTQFVSVADLGSHLPAPVAPGAAYPAVEDAPLPSATVVAAPALPPAAASVPRIAARPVPPQAPAAAAPVQVAAAAPARLPAPPRPARAEPRDEAANAPRPAQAALTSPAPMPSPRAAAPVVSVATAPIKAPRPAPAVAEAAAPHAAPPRAPVAQATWTPAPSAPAPASAAAYQPAQYSPAAYSPPASAMAQSALGGPRASLPPPVPYGAQSH